MAESSESYQLKWHSYSSHLHTCVASSLTSEMFADVSLCTTDGHYIMAHRFVLSACSQYLHQVLKFQQKITTTLPLVIILPPEISYRTIKTLISYMYSGETTVSKDILENVLRGGDILKVKGLWRPKEDRSNEKKLAKVQEQRNTQSVSGNVTPIIGETSQNQNQKESTSDNIHISNAVEVNRSDLSNQKTVSSSTDSNSNHTSSSKGQSHKDNNEDKMSTIKSALGESSTLQYLVIKDEPIEWSELEEEEMEILENAEMFNTEMDIKPEVIMDENEGKTEELYSPLTCELCSETFTLPAEWVRHIQTHTDMLPAKRQRRGRSTDEDSGSFPPLHCDMCQQHYVTPAEWVRHIQNAHTEFELRVSNKTTPTKPLRVYRAGGSTHKMCTMCNKRFPSHASMLIHKRTHTGEKPYKCEHCQKGFNVKSNLLRHLRTLHDKIINSTDVEYKEDGKSSSNSNSDF